MDHIEELTLEFVRDDDTTVIVEYKSDDQEITVVNKTEEGKEEVSTQSFIRENFIENLVLSTDMTEKKSAQCPS